MSSEASDFGEETMDLWRVRMPDGDERVITLERLDDLFQNGLITEQTLVLEEGTTQWRTLADVAGLGAPPPAPQPAPLFVAPPPAAMREMAAALSTTSTLAAPMSAPPPVVADIPDLDELEYPRPSKKKWLVVAAAAALVVTGLSVAVTSAGGTPESTATAAGAALTSNVSTSIAAPPPPAKVEPPTPPADVKPQLTDEQRKALLGADKARDARLAKKKGERTTPKPARRAPKSGTPFHKGGSKFDPLNGAL
jgi:hypothetical protein